MMDYIKNPMEIENASMRIIESEIGEHSFSKEELLIVKRIIHTTADFEYKNLVEISKDAIEASKKVFKKSFTIYTDTNMALSGINKIALSKLNGKAICYVNLDELNVPYIRVKGRKGGSTVAAAIVNALMYNVYER